MSTPSYQTEDALYESTSKSVRCIRNPAFPDAAKSLDNSDFGFNKKLQKRLVFELAIARFVDHREDVLFTGQPGTGKGQLAQAIGLASIHQGHKVIYREAHILIEELAEVWSQVIDAAPSAETTTIAAPRGEERLASDGARAR